MSNIFISHRKKDSDKAEKLAQELIAAKHNVWIDVWNIHLGDSVIQRINEGLQGSNYVVLCYSSEGIETPWMGREWMSTLARQLEGDDVKLLPVILSKTREIPAILADFKYADLTQNWQEGVNQILKATDEKN